MPEQPRIVGLLPIDNQCGADALLEVYGHYTCFVPNNDAIAAYLEEKGKTLDELTAEEAPTGCLQFRDSW